VSAIPQKRLSQQALIEKPVSLVGDRIIESISMAGAFILYLYDIFRQAVHRPYRTSLIFQHLEFIGNQSLNIIIMTGFFTGAVFGLQIGGIFEIFQAEGLMGGATGKALCRELAPLMTGFLLAGRAGSAMTAELATMTVNEQVDAMEAMAVDPINYLVVPRMIASLVMLPFLCSIFIFIGVLGAFFSGVVIFDVDQGVFIEKIIWLVQPKDIWAGLEKTLAFAVIIASIACKYGLEASGGAKGVGVATTDSVVVTLLTILGSDFLITYFQVAW
jgi:phospholipid/cholesterol/gamma-HCH transport system permease protein